MPYFEPKKFDCASCECCDLLKVCEVEDSKTRLDADIRIRKVWWRELGLTLRVQLVPLAILSTPLGLLIVDWRLSIGKSFQSTINNQQSSIQGVHQRPKRAYGIEYCQVEAFSSG